MKYNCKLVSRAAVKRIIQVFTAGNGAHCCHLTSNTAVHAIVDASAGAIVVTGTLITYMHT